MLLWCGRSGRGGKEGRVIFSRGRNESDSDDDERCESKDAARVARGPVKFGLACR